MTRSIRTRIARGAVIGGVSIAAVLGTAGAAFAQQDAGGLLRPGNELCTPGQFANYQVRGVLDAASGQGVKMKLYKGSTVVETLPGRVPGGSLQELGTNFSGPGTYKFCVQNTGTTNSTITGVDAFGNPVPGTFGLHLYTDAEVH